MKTKSRLVFLFGPITFFVGLSAQAATETWDGGGADNNWTTGTNWLDNTAPIATDSLVFDQNVRLTPANDFAAATQFNGLSFATSAGVFTLSGNSVTLGGDITNNSVNAQTSNIPLILSATRSIDVSSRMGSLSLSGVISGATFGITKTGNGLLTLSGANSFTGPVTINGGTLAVATDGTGTTNPLGNGNASAASITLNGGALRTTASVLLSTNRSVVLGTSGGTFDQSTNNTLDYNGVISGGANSFTKTGRGTLDLGGVSTYTGNTTINQGTLRLDFNALGGTTTNIINSGSALILGGASTSVDTPQNFSGATLTALGKAAAASDVSQTFNGVTLNQGNTAITTSQSAGLSGVLVNLNAITQNSGGFINFNRGGTASATNAITTTTANDASGILGGWAIYNNTNYATNGGAGVGITNYAAYTDVGASGAIADSGGGTPTNINFTAGGTMTLSGTTNSATNVNTIRQGNATAATINVGSGRLRLGVEGGILLAADQTLAISGGTLTAGGNTLNTAGEIIVTNMSFNKAITIGSIIANNNTSTGATNSAGAGAVTLTVNAPGTGANGTNAVALNGANTYSGGTFINAGRVSTNNSAAFGTGSVTVLSGGQAYVNTPFANNFFIAGVGTGENNGLGAIRAQNGTINGIVTLIGDARIGAQGGIGTFAGEITGNYNLDISNQNSGTVILANTAGTNSWTGNTSIGNLGATTLRLGAANQIGNGAGFGNVGFNNASTLDLNGFSETINGLVSGTGSFVQNGTAAAANTVTLTVGDGDATATFAAVLRNNNGGSGVLALTKIGLGTQVLSGTAANSYTGVTTVNGGVFELAKTGVSAVLGNLTIGDGAATAGNDIVRLAGSGDNQIADTSLVTFNGTGANAGILRLNNTNETIAGLSSTADAGIVENGSATAGTVTLTTNVTSGTQTFSGVLQNGGTGLLAVTKTGSGTQTLTGTNTYSGATTISGGTLALGVTGLFDNSPVITVNGILDTSAKSSFTIGGTQTLNGNGTVIVGLGSTLTVASSGTVAAGNSPGELTFSGGTTVLDTGSIFSWELNDNVDSTTGTRGVGGNYDGLTTTNSGNLSVSAGAIFRVVLAAAVDGDHAFWNTTRTWNNIFTVAGGTTLADVANNHLFDTLQVLDSTTGSLFTPVNGSFTFTGSALTWSAVPEPTSALAGLLLGAGLLRRRRRI